MTPEDEEFNRIEREANMQIPTPDSIAKYVDALVKGTHEISSLTIRPKRAWVGLTAKDWNGIGFTAEFRAGAEWANDKLKEKNT